MMKFKWLYLIVLIFILLGYTNNLLAAQACDLYGCSTPSPIPGPGGDNPDENFAVDSGNPPFEPSFNSDLNAIVYKTGFHEFMLSLLSYTKHGYVKADINTSATDLLNASNLLIIPSGGLYGMEGSDFFRASLDEYVNQGGTLIVFAQQHGYEYSVLPVPQETDGTYNTVQGYGWTEDQSCFSNAAYIDTYHQILSGQIEITPNLHVDGYFTNYPSEATVLFRRNANDQPAMFMYDYGLGKVIVTSMYSDYAYGHSQASLAEKALVRDMVSWAKAPDTLPEISPGDTVSLQMAVTNLTTTDAVSVKFYIYSPDRSTLLSEQTNAVGLAAGQTTTVSVSYASASTSTLGIYHVDYELLDSDSNIIQPQAETESGRFVISSPPGDPYKEHGLNISVTTPSEYIILNQDVPFTVTLWNNTDNDERIRLYGGWDHSPRTFIDEVTVPSKGSLSNNYTIISTGGSLWVDVFSESGLQIRSKALYHFTDETWPYAGSVPKGFKIISASVDVTLQTGKTIYTKGENVTLTLDITNGQKAGYSTNGTVRVTDPDNNPVFSDTFNTDISSEGSYSQNFSFILPAAGKNGYYTAYAEAIDSSSGKKIGGDSTSFDVPSALLSLTPALPDTLSSDSAFQASFNVSNIWITDVTDAALKVDFTDPNSGILFTNTESFSILSGQTNAFTYNISTGPLVFGDYLIKYSLSYGEKTTDGEKKLSREYIIKNTFDKTTYSIGDTINATVNVTNNGSFADSLVLELNIPEFSYTDSANISVPTGQSINRAFAIPVPLDALAGKQSMSVSLGGTASTFDFYIPDSKLELSVSVAGNNAGDDITITVANTGGGGTGYDLTAKLIDKHGVPINEVNFTGTVSANESKDEIFTIPAGALTGDYRLSINATDTVTAEVTSLIESLTITGVSATLDVTADKTVYLPAESHLSTSAIVSTGIDISNASLELKVIPAIGTGIVSGIVTDAETFSPLSGAKITVGSKTGYTAADGAYTIVDVSLGIQTITAEYPGYDINTAQIDISEGNQDYNFGLLSSKYGDLNGTVNDSVTNEPVVGAKIDLAPKDVVSEEQIARIDHSGFDGTFDTIRLAVGSYSVTITKDGYTTLETEVQIAEGINQEQFLFEKIPIIDPPPTLGELTGNVIDNTTGTLLLGVNVVLYGTVSDRVPEFEQKYHFYDIAPGSHTLSVNFAGYDLYETSIDIVAGEQNFDIQLIPSTYGTIAGTVKEASTGDPVPGAKIELTPQDLVSSDRFSKILHSDFTGSYSFNNNLPAGTYSVRVTREYYTELNTTVVLQQGGNVFDIDLSQSEPYPGINEIEPNNIIAEATPLPLDASGSGTIYNDPDIDHDYYKITIPAGGDIKITLNDIPDTKLYDIRLYNSSGTNVKNVYGVPGPGPAVLEYSSSDAGNYYFRIEDYYGTSSTSPYRVKAEFVPLDEDIYTYNEPNNDIATAIPLELDTTEIGYIYNDPDIDHDYYKITIPVKGTIKVTVNDIPDTKFYDIRLYNSSGTNVKNVYGVPGPGPAVLEYSSSDAGDYYFRIEEYYGTSSTSPYRVKAEFVPLDEDIYTYNEPNNDIATAIPLDLDTTEIGYIYNDPDIDHDYYKITIPAGGDIKITLNDIPDTKFYDIRFYNSSGDNLTNVYFVQSPGPAVLEYFSSDAGDYYFRIEDYYGTSSISPYRVYATFSPESLPSQQQVIFEKTISPVSLSGTQTIDENIPAVGMSGKYLLTGVLKSGTSQEIAKAEYPFYVIDGDFAFTLSADKKFYRPGETITVAGEVKNLSAVQADGVAINVTDEMSGAVLYTDTAVIPAGGGYQFTAITTAGTEGVYNLKGTAEQDSAVIAETHEQYSAVNPSVSADITAPAVAGNGPFEINVILTNEGEIEANVQLDVSSLQLNDSRNITIPSGETEFIQYQGQITGDTDYTFAFTGDLVQTTTETVSYGLSASIAINQQSTYSEGTVAVPVTITNTGQLNETLGISFQLSKQSSVVSQQSKTYYIPEAGSITDTLYFDLTEGDYTLSAASQNPTVTSEGIFTVKKDIDVAMTVSAGALSSSVIPVTVNLTNIGYSEFSGAVRLSVTDTLNQTVWNSEQSVTHLVSSGNQSLTFDLNPSAMGPADYILKAELFDSSNNQIALDSGQLTIEGAVFQIVQLPASQTFYPNDQAVFAFTVRNTGNQNGAAELNFNAYDLIDSSQIEWLAPGEEKAITFSFMLPDDLEENDYFADYELKAVQSQQTIEKGQVNYHFSGINLDVNVSLDKQNYNVGDTVHLTLLITDNSAQVTDLNLFAKVNYADYNSEQAFTLNGSTTITFDIPLTEITGEKLFYGIYYESGRSIHLNSLYIYKEESALTITTDKQVYNPSETVTITLSGNTSGSLTLTGPEYEETFDFTGSDTRSFTLPFEMTAGTYYINAELLTTDSEFITASLPIDIAGISVKVKEATLDKSKYASSDTLNLSLTIESNQDLSATLKTWTVDPDGSYTSSGEQAVTLSSTENIVVADQSLLSTDILGIHRLVYGIYSGDLLLASGAEAFDVGEAVLLGLSTDKADYPVENETVTAIVSVYGTVDASLELQLDGSTIVTQGISLNNTVTLNIDIGTTDPGTHNLTAILTAGGLTSTKETTFTYTLSLHDSDSDGMLDDWEEANSLNPYDSSDALLDPDNDGLTNLQEHQNNTDPNNPDTDNDGMPDGWEVAHGLNPNEDDALSDNDSDGFSNLEEYQNGTDPSDPASVPNLSPVADAGSDQNAITGEPVTLDGSGSYDPEGGMITFLWTFTNVPAGSSITDASLSDVTGAKPTFTPDSDGTYALGLTVSDGELQGTDTVSVLAAVPNVAPNADAGPDQNVYTGNPVYLDGSASSDPDNGPQPLSYLWSFSAIPQGSGLIDADIIDKELANASFTPDADGIYAARLAVNDGELTSEDEVSIIATTPNIPPNASAGEDITIYLGAPALLDGSASYDPDNWPQPLTYSWRFVALPTGSGLTNSDLSGADTVTVSFTPDIVGTYVLELMVNDGQESVFDNAGCTVVYSSPDPDFFLPPVKENRVFKLNSTIPVKFQLTDASGAYISTAVATIVLQQYSEDEPLGDPIDATSTSGADSGNIFRYDSGNQYIYNLSTKSLTKGTWQIRVDLDDGTTRTVFIGLK